MPNWIPYAFVTIFALATADIAVKFAAGKISNSLGMLIYGSCVFLISLSWVIYQYSNGVQFHAERQGVIAAFVVGISFCTVTFGLYFTFEAGARISLSSPMIRVGGLVLASLFGLLAFRETLNLQYSIGVLLALVGVALLITR